MAFLNVSEVGVSFGGVVALDSMSFALDKGEILALIGPNGAGKTTLFNVVSRLYNASAGRVRLGDVDLLGLPSHHIARHGIARTFQNLALVPGLSVVDNVMVGAHSTSKGGFWASMTWLATRSEERRTRHRALEVLEMLELSQYATRPCAGLPFGTLKRVELARALMSNPQLLMLDEPASGLTHGEVDELVGVIRRLRDEHSISVLLIEHHMGMVMSISDRIVVMDLGRKIAEGTPQEIQNNERVIAAYLGEDPE